MSAVHLVIKGQKYLATFCEATTTCGLYYRVVRQEKNTDNLRGGYIVRVDEEGRPLSCTCPDFHGKNQGFQEVAVKRLAREVGTYLCKHCIAINGLHLQKKRSFQEEAIRCGAIVPQVPNPIPTLSEFVAMKPGDVRIVNGHRVERFASAWKVDDTFVVSWNQLSDFLRETHVF